MSELNCGEAVRKPLLSYQLATKFRFGSQVRVRPIKDCPSNRSTFERRVTNPLQTGTTHGGMAALAENRSFVALDLSDGTGFDSSPPPCKVAVGGRALKASGGFMAGPPTRGRAPQRRHRPTAASGWLASGDRARGLAGRPSGVVATAAAPVCGDRGHLCLQEDRSLGKLCFSGGSRLRPAAFD
jgi:hypothetical protein